MAGVMAGPSPAMTIWKLGLVGTSRGQQSGLFQDAYSYHNESGLSSKKLRIMQRAIGIGEMRCAFPPYDSPAFAI